MVKSTGIVPTKIRESKTNDLKGSISDIHNDGLQTRQGEIKAKTSKKISQADTSRLHKVRSVTSPVNKTRTPLAKHSGKSSNNQRSKPITETRHKVKITGYNNPKPSRTHSKTKENIQKTSEVGASKPRALQPIEDDFKPSCFSRKQAGKKEDVQTKSKVPKPKVETPYTSKYLKRSLETEILRKV